MSKRKYWGRFTAMGVAGLAAVSSIAIVADAATSITKVYEFSYAGIAMVPKTAASASALNGNKYVKAGAADVTKPFTIAYAAGNVATFNGCDITLANFALDQTTTNGDTANGWVYRGDASTSTTAAFGPATVSEIYNNRSGGGTYFTFYFKSKADRDAALRDVQSKVKSNYTNLYNKALSALRTDLSNAATKIYTQEELDARNQRDKDLAQAKAWLDDGTYTSATYSAAVTTINKTYTDAVALSNKWRTARNQAATQIVNEFMSAYKPENYLWNHTVDLNTYTYDQAAYLVDDSMPEVTITTIGGVLDPAATLTATYKTVNGGTLNLYNCSYRKSSAYTNPNRYAFAGEIALTTDASTQAYEVSDQWVRFPDYTQGSDGGTGTGTGTDTSTGTSNWLPAASYQTPSSTSYLGNNGYWYTSSGAANTYGGGYSGTSIGSNYNSGLGQVYFCADDGFYYTSPKGNSYRVSDFTGNNVFYNSATGRYYLTESAARNANSSGVITGYTRTSAAYFNSKTGQFYTSVEAAVNATGSVADVTTSSGAAVSYTASDSSDPYYQWYLANRGNTANANQNNTAVAAGSPAIYGSSKNAGWTKITTYINRSQSGSTVKISMNEGTSVPADVLAAAKAKGVTLQIINSNGSKWTIQPGRITSARALYTGIKYNTSDVKSSLVTKAKKANPGTVSTAQVTIGGGDSFGLTAGVTVKLPAKRSGCTVKAYRLNGSKLVNEATSKVQSNGQVTFNLDKGGSYLLVVID